MDVLVIGPPYGQHNQVEKGKCCDAIGEGVLYVVRDDHYNVKQVVYRVVNWITRVHEYWEYVYFWV
jgi:hypothetical protein